MGRRLNDQEHSRFTSSSQIQIFISFNDNYSKLTNFFLGFSCETMCRGNDCPCLCDSWVFCENKEACRSRFGEEKEEEEEEEQAKLKESISKQKDVGLEEMTVSIPKEAEIAKAKTLEKHDDLCELSRALAILASSSSVSWEREEFLSLVNKEVELYNSMVEKEGTEAEEEAKKAYQAAREHSDSTAHKAIGDNVSSALIDRVDAMLQKHEKNDVDAKIGDRWLLLDIYDGKEIMVDNQYFKANNPLLVNGSFKK